MISVLIPVYNYNIQNLVENLLNQLNIIDFKVMIIQSGTNFMYPLVGFQIICYRNNNALQKIYFYRLKIM